MRSGGSFFWVGGVWLVLASLRIAIPEAQPERLEVWAPQSVETVREAMLGALEEVVQRERFYRRRTGAFTPVLGKLDYQLPQSIRGEVEIRVSSADREHLVVEAFREGGNGAAEDRVWMDEHFRVQATFPVRGLRWVAVQKQVPSEDSDSALPALEVEPLSATASSEITAE